MKTTMVALALCALAAGCSQTTQEQAGAEQPAPRARTATAAQDRCSQAVAGSVRTQQNAMVAGSILSAAGGLGGFGGRGGAIIGQAASVGGSIVRAQASADARNAVFEECR